MLGVSGSNLQYYAAYAFFISLFMAVVILSIAFSKYFFKIVKKENYMENTKMLIKLVSILQYLFFTLLTVPFLTLVF